MSLWWHMMSGGPWWTRVGVAPIAAYQPKGAASLAASLVNLWTPGTYDITSAALPTLGAGGWVFNGSTQYGNAGIAVSGIKTVVIRYSDYAWANANTALAGARDASDATGLTLWAYLTSGTAHGYDFGSRLSISGALPASSVVGVSGPTAYLGGSAESGSTVGATTNTRPLYIGAANIIGVMLAPMAVTIQAVWISDQTITLAQYLVLRALMLEL
jgi:hypothetical protein